jgi:hypothetical protein
MLAELTLTELPPLDEGELGRSYVFKRGEQVWADHEAVLDAPAASCRSKNEFDPPSRASRSL